MSQTRLQELSAYGQSLWLDYIDRPLLETGKLKNLISQGLGGMTSNPSIFNQAIGSSNNYDKMIVQLKSQGKSVWEIYDELTIRDIQDACDQFKSVYDQTNGLDGYVSLEINPQLAKKTSESISEGLRLYKKVNRPNVMIKVPSTNEGFLVIEELIAQGISVNVTLIFSAKQYVKTVQAYFKGLRELKKRKGDPSKVRSVASVFVSRIDNVADKMIEGKLANEPKLKDLLGKAAVANSRIILEKFKEFHSSEEFKQLFEANANEQRVLWASTGTKNPNYSDIKYVTELISKPTVNTLPEKTLMAFMDHGVNKPGMDYPVKQALDVVSALAACGVNVDDICAKLLEEGVVAFEDSFKSLFDSLEKKSTQLSVR